MTKLNIKNMVCNRCIKVVKEELEKLGFTVTEIELGDVEVKENLIAEDYDKIREVMNENGFELIEDSKKKIVEEIKKVIINKIHYSDEPGEENISSLLEEKLNKDYASLSKLFSSIENITIEHFVILQKIEKVKELLRYGELTLSEIAYKLGYKSVNHLSSQFKKHTGLTATEFKSTTSLKRKPLDSIK